MTVHPPIDKADQDMDQRKTGIADHCMRISFICMFHANFLMCLKKLEVVSCGVGSYVYGALYIMWGSVTLRILYYTYTYTYRGNAVYIVSYIYAYIYVLYNTRMHCIVVHWLALGVSGSSVVS